MKKKIKKMGAPQCSSNGTGIPENFTTVLGHIN